MHAMDASMEPRLPAGHWTHSFEEDEGGVEVYRPTVGFDFPPARQPRTVLEVGADGALAEGGPGPDDRPALGPVRAPTPLGMNRYAVGDGVVIEVVEAESDVLRIRRLAD